MLRILLLAIYLLGGWAIYPLVKHLSGLGEELNAIYAWVGLDSGSELAVYQLLSFAYASVFHFVLAVFLSEPAKVWTDNIYFKEMAYLFVRLLAYFIFCFLTLGVVGLNIKWRPYSSFNMYFSILVPCVLLGSWSWSLRDCIIGASYCKAMRRV